MESLNHLMDAHEKLVEFYDPKRPFERIIDDASVYMDFTVPRYRIASYIRTTIETDEHRAIRKLRHTKIKVGCGRLRLKKIKSSILINGVKVHHKKIKDHHKKIKDLNQEQQVQWVRIKLKSLYKDGYILQKVLV